jgi:hypothetical protein
MVRLHYICAGIPPDSVTHMCARRHCVESRLTKLLYRKAKYRDSAELDWQPCPLPHFCVDRDKTTILTAEEFDIPSFGDNTPHPQMEWMIPCRPMCNLWALQCTLIQQNLWDILKLLLSDMECGLWNVSSGGNKEGESAMTSIFGGESIYLLDLL